MSSVTGAPARAAVPAADTAPRADDVLMAPPIAPVMPISAAKAGAFRTMLPNTEPQVPPAIISCSSRHSVARIASSRVSVSPRSILRKAFDASRAADMSPAAVANIPMNGTKSHKLPWNSASVKPYCEVRVRTATSLAPYSSASSSSCGTKDPSMSGAAARACLIGASGLAGWIGNEGAVAPGAKEEPSSDGCENGAGWNKSAGLVLPKL